MNRALLVLKLLLVHTIKSIKVVVGTFHGAHGVRDGAAPPTELAGRLRPQPVMTMLAHRGTLRGRIHVHRACSRESDSVRGRRAAIQFMSLALCSRRSMGLSSRVCNTVCRSSAWALA